MVTRCRAKYQTTYASGRINPDGTRRTGFIEPGMRCRSEAFEDGLCFTHYLMKQEGRLHDEKEASKEE